MSTVLIKMLRSERNKSLHKSKLITTDLLPFGCLAFFFFNASADSSAANKVNKKTLVF